MSNFGDEKSVMDIVFYEGKLYAIDSNDLFAINIEKADDTGEPRVSRIECVVMGPPLSFTRGANFVDPSQFLVEYHGALLVERPIVKKAIHLRLQESIQCC
jgi:hypothetical protein